MLQSHDHLVTSTSRSEFLPTLQRLCIKLPAEIQDAGSYGEMTSKSMEVAIGKISSRLQTVVKSRVQPSFGRNVSSLLAPPFSSVHATYFSQAEAI